MLRFDVITLFPEIFDAVTKQGITSRAIKRGLWSVHFWNPRDVTEDVHRTVDERPFGGGPGMVMMAEPLARTLAMIRKAGNNGPVILFSPSGCVLTDQKARQLAQEETSYVLICGRYEGIDERFIEEYVNQTISLGDFILSGAEIPACALMDAVVRQLPGALKELSVEDESFATGLLDAPHYTRPEVWHGKRVPEILLTGHHANIARWTREKALEKTVQNRPDLIKMARSARKLTEQDEEFLKQFKDF